MCAGSTAIYWSRWAWWCLSVLAAKNAILISGVCQSKPRTRGRTGASMPPGGGGPRTRKSATDPDDIACVYLWRGTRSLWLRSAGAEMRQSLGTAVFAGMLGVTLFGLVFTPVFYVCWRVGLCGPGATAGRTNRELNRRLESTRTSYPPRLGSLWNVDAHGKSVRLQTIAALHQDPSSRLISGDRGVVCVLGRGDSCGADTNRRQGLRARVGSGASVIGGLRCRPASLVRVSFIDRRTLE